LALSTYQRVIEGDIKGCFDEISQQWLIRFLEHRIGDRRIILCFPKIISARSDDAIRTRLV
jgi:RNA-directed DNA polymerase